MHDALERIARQRAKLLGVDRKTLYNKLHHYGIE